MDANEAKRKPPMQLSNPTEADLQNADAISRAYPHLTTNTAVLRWALKVAGDKARKQLAQVAQGAK